MTNDELEALTDHIGTERLLEYARNGNMLAKRALIIRRNMAELSLSLQSFRTVAGEEQVKSMWEKVHYLTSQIAQIPTVGKTELGHEADDYELNHA